MANNSPFPRIILLCPGRQNRVLIWIDGHIPPRVTEFFLTDWMHGHLIGYVRVSGLTRTQNAKWWCKFCGTLDTRNDSLLPHLSPLGWE